MKIAVIGSSYSRGLNVWVKKPGKTLMDESTISRKYGPFKRKRYETTDKIYEACTDSFDMKIDYDNNWVNLLAKQCPQHEFYVFAVGGGGWEYIDVTLNTIAELKLCDRVIIELQNYRAFLPKLDNNFIPTSDIIFNNLQLGTAYEDYHVTTSTLTPNVSYWREYPVYMACISASKGQLDSKSNNKKEWVKDELIRVTKPQDESWITDDILNMYTEAITGDVIVSRYERYLKSLNTIWPKVFDKVGIWAYCPFDIPWINIKYNKTIFNNTLTYFENDVLKKWIKEDPIRNTFESFFEVYYGLDKGHLNKEGMVLLSNFLLEQPSIQKVLE